MTGDLNKLFQFWQELKRRKVVRVITVYAAAAFVILELTSIIVDPLRLPDWTLSLVLVLLCIGFIIAVILSWIFDIHPERGIVKTEPVQNGKAEKKPVTSNRWKIATYVSIIIIIALVFVNIIGINKQPVVDTNLLKSIAVLPFKNFSADDDQEYMCNGLTDEIINQLFKIKSFDKVVSLNTVLTYKETEKRIPEIASELDVNYILEGTYKKIGDQVRVTAQLIEPINDKHIWQNEFDRPFEEIITIQTNIAQTIASELRTIISPDEIEALEQKPTESFEAYNLYLRGRYCIHEHTEAGYLDGIQYFEKAINLDKNYTLAYIWFAYCYKELSRVFGYSREQGYEKAKEALKKSMEIDETIGDAHAMLASILFLSDWEISKPEAGFNKALELSPRSVQVNFLHAQYLMWTDRIDESIEYYKKALEIDPFNLYANQWLGGTYFYGNRYDESINQFNNMFDFVPDYPWGHVYLAHNYSMTGMFKEANYHADKVASLNDNFLLSALGADYARSGREERAWLILDQILGLPDDDAVDPTMIALIYAGLGMEDEVIKWLNKAYEEHSSLMVYLKVYSRTFLKGLSSDPRFIELLEKMGFETDDS